MDRRVEDDPAVRQLAVPQGRVLDPVHLAASDEQQRPTEPVEGTSFSGSEVHRIKDPALWHGKLPYGGVILNSSVHNFYLFKWLFGGVRDVRGMASRLIPEGQAEDNGLMLGHLANGAEFQLFTSCTIEIPWTERLEVYGSKGGLVIDQLANPVAKYFQGSGDFEGTVLKAFPSTPLPGSTTPSSPRSRTSCRRLPTGGRRSSIRWTRCMPSRRQRQRRGPSSWASLSHCRQPKSCQLAGREDHVG